MITETSQDGMFCCDDFGQKREQSAMVEGYAVIRSGRDDILLYEGRKVYTPLCHSLSLHLFFRDEYSISAENLDIMIYCQISLSMWLHCVFL